MESLSTAAFVLRTRAYGESDVIAVMLTHDYGKLSGIARGARRSRKRFAGPSLEPFQEIELRFARRPHSELAFLHECKLLESYHRIADDLESFAWASYICELTERMTPERDPAPDIYSLFRDTLAALSAREQPEPRIHHFVLGLLDRAGWGPDFTRCGICGEEVTASTRPILDARGSGVVCAGHEAERAGFDPADPAYRPSRRVITRELLDYVAQARASVVGEIEPKLRRDATALLDRLVDLHLTRPLNSRRFLAEIRSTEGARSG